MSSVSRAMGARIAMCGPRALQRVARRLGVVVAADQIARLAGTDERGTSLLGLRNAATALGLEGRMLRTNYRGLEMLPKPLVVHMRSGHYEVVEGCRTEGVLLGGLWTRRKSRTAFEMGWSGVALVLRRNPGSEVNNAK